MEIFGAFLYSVLFHAFSLQCSSKKHDVESGGPKVGFGGNDYGYENQLLQQEVNHCIYFLTGKKKD